jgi:phosphopantetheinyl transferase
MQQFLVGQASVFARLAAAPGTAVGTPAVSPLPSVPAPAAAVDVPVDAWPLLGPRIEDASPGAAFACRFDLAQHAYLADHVIGGALSTRRPELRGLAVVPFTFTLELVAEAASRVAGAGRRVVAMRRLRGSRWLTLERGAVSLVVRTEPPTVEGNDRAVRVRVFQTSDPEGQALRAIPGPPSGLLVFEGEVVLAERFPEPPEPLVLADPARRASRFRDEDLYTTGMFHGPMMQGVKHIHGWSAEGIEADLEVLPVDGFLRGSPRPRFLIDPGLLDAAGQLVGYWASEQVDGYDFNCFPFSIDLLEQFAPPGPPGARVRCRLAAAFAGETQIDARFDLIDAAGRVIARQRGRRDRYFRVPESFYRCRLDPQRHFLSRSCEADVPDVAVRRLDPFPEHFLEEGWGIWARVLAHLVLAPDELVAWYARSGPARVRAQWLLGRVAAKDAVRQWMAERHALVLAPVDVEIRKDPRGRPVAWIAGGAPVVPDVSISHSDGHCVAAAVDPALRVGVDLERGPRELERVRHGFTPEELAALDALDARARDEAVLALWAAKEAASKALGTGLEGAPRAWRVDGYSPGGGEVAVLHRGVRLPVRVRAGAGEGFALCAIPNHPASETVSDAATATGGSELR